MHVILCAFLLNDLIIFTLKNGFLLETSQESFAQQKNRVFFTDHLRPKGLLTK